MAVDFVQGKARLLIKLSRACFLFAENLIASSHDLRSIAVDRFAKACGSRQAGNQNSRPIWGPPGLGWYYPLR